MQRTPTIRRLVAAIEYVKNDADGDLGTDDDRPSLFGEPFDGPMEGHEPGQPVHYDLHAWMWRHNPAGELAQFNPGGELPMTPSPLIDATFGAMAAKTVHAAAELRLADLLASGLHSTQELAERTHWWPACGRASPAGTGSTGCRLAAAGFGQTALSGSLPPHDLRVIEAIPA